MRILALDWGTVRVGAAISDPDQTIAFPLNKIIPGKTAIQEIKKICKEEEVETILLGLPKTLSNADSESTKKVYKYKDELEQATGIGVELIDERLSSVGAQKTLSNAGLNEKKQKDIKDNIVAQFLLQTYLDQRLKK
jgi:putative holliday junction resolvase